MTVRRIMGIETEYGISVPGDPLANPMFLSGQVVSVYAAAHGIRSNQSSWDYEFEDPLRDARGWQLSRTEADESQLTDSEDPSLANVVLPNGARYYVDHAHPEYSSPEVTTPRDAVVWDRAGDAIALESVRLLADRPDHQLVNLYKNNADGKGQSYGAHENYLMPRRTPFPEIVRHLVPFFVTRQVICGAGRVGIGVDSKAPGFQISQRADFFETEVGLETTLKRPIINTRDEPHAVADRFRRLHVIIGDANQLDVACLLKLGTTSLVLGMIETGHLAEPPSIRRPVAALQAVSHDPSLTTRLELLDGRSMTALDIQWSYLEAARAWLDGRRDDPAPEATEQVMTLWEDVLTRLGRDVMSCAPEIDWVAKLQLLQGYRTRDGMTWDDHRLAAIDIQWADVRPEKGLVHRLRDRGRTRELVSSEEVKAAQAWPPEDTRAWFRGTCVRRFAPNIFSASWDSVVFDVPGQASLQRVPILEPERGTREQVGELLEQSHDVRSLLAGLAAPE
ncbi:MAG: proteasome accessory factor PafA2 [Intrasporangium sp.]|uniref:depupylase/deamidase Dop n=1 Tax=Intrasporangium sp. TaxID=1925024 RepID=UPI00264994BB|nr:depupylase/deamidase Dop [Intrasporangium sp.]MDN5794675.1 proteasome accessory factor PafA2 [Intrasporangium sp.]